MWYFFWSYMESFVVGISGASGCILGVKTVIALAENGFAVDVIFTEAARKTASLEIERVTWTDAYIRERFSTWPNITVHDPLDIGARCASGTYRSRGMIIAPCSMSTLAAVSIGLSDNLLRRGADVAMKEGRPLVLVPREMPFSSIHLEHMTSLSRRGVKILVPQPAWYLHPQTIDQVEDHFVTRLLEQIGIFSPKAARWEG
jgi:flavin prenyltransferase